MPHESTPQIDLTEARPPVAYSFAVLQSLAAAMATVVGKWNLTEISPLLMNAMIFSVATVVLSGTMLPYRGAQAVFTHSRRGWFWIGLFTLSSLAAVWAYWAGVQKIDPSLAAFLNRAEVPIAILLGIILLGERLTRMETTGTLLAIAGIVVMRLTLRVEYSAGFWLVLLGSVFFGITELLSKIAVKHVRPIVLAYLRNMFMAVGYWIIFLVSGQGFGGFDKVWLGVVALGFLGPLASRVMYLMALRHLQLSKVAVISQSQPVFVVAIALLVFGQLPSVREIGGGVLLTVGCLLMIVSRKPYLNRNRIKN